MYLTYKGIQPTLASAFRANNITGVAAHGGSYQLWGGKGDLIFTTATTAEEVSLGPGASLSFWTWYDIEQYWDFGFVQVSTDGGTIWESLANAHTTSEADPSAISTVVANLPGFTGSSGGWVQETFDLSNYEGDTVLLRFLYITDWATVLGGFYVDDLVLSDASGILLQDNMEVENENWELDGWQRTTGLAENDWELTFLNPVYDRGKLDEVQIQDSNVYIDGIYQRDLTVLNTQKLTSDVVTIVVSNHLPEATSYSSTYRLLVEKEPAKK
jgi:bacillopeptidase F (M6 metalloprotease family)